MTEINKQVEQLLMQFQIQNQQLENVIIQKQNYLAQKQDIEDAIKELENDGEVYKIVGPILIKSETEKLKGELEERKDDTNMKIKTMEKNEKKLREMVEISRAKLQEILPTLQTQQPEEN